jgi:hypothetical protein
VVGDIYQLQRRVISATLMSRLVEWSHLGMPPFEIIKVTLMECLEADGCSIMCRIPDEPHIRCVATSGLTLHGVEVPLSDSYYTLSVLTDHESELRRQCPVDANDPKHPVNIKGITRTLLSCGGRTIRMLDVADIRELGKLYFNPTSVPQYEPLLKEESSDQKTRWVTFTPVYLCSEAKNPGESYHHRFLGVSFGKAWLDNEKRGEENGSSNTPALAAFRLIRGIYSRPFVRYDEYVLQDLARMTASLFRASVDERIRYGRRLGELLGADNLRDWPPGVLDGQPFSNVDESTEKERNATTRQEAVRRLLYAAIGPVDWNRNAAIGFLQDLLTVFEGDGALLASVRFTAVCENSNVVMRPYEVLSKYTQRPPDEKYGADVSCRHPNHAWLSVFHGQPVMYEATSDDWIHSDSMGGVGFGICMPFRFFGHDHAVDGVVSLEFEKQQKDMPWPKWTAKHLHFLALATRQFSWAASSNSPEFKVTDPDLEVLESLNATAEGAWKWFCDKTNDELGNVNGSFELIQKMGRRRRNPNDNVVSDDNDVESSFDSVVVRSIVVRLFNSESPKVCVCACPVDAMNTAPKDAEWWRVNGTDADGKQRFINHRDLFPDAEFQLYGARLIDAGKLFQEPPAESCVVGVTFPLFIGAACVGHVECEVTFRRGDLQADGTLGPEYKLSPWSKHFRELRRVFSRVTELWCQFACGNLMLANRKSSLWTVAVSRKGRGKRCQFHLEYSWGSWTMKMT